MLNRLIRTFIVITISTLIYLASGISANADLIWWDGSRESGNTPPGKLLSDNTGYWGDCVLTGVDYTYETQPQDQSDIQPGTTKTYRHLLDGDVNGNRVPKDGNNISSLAVLFDFKRNCTFNEFDVFTRNGKAGITIECADNSVGPWKKAYDISLQDSPDVILHRIKLQDKASGRYVRLRLQAKNAAQIEEFAAWGDAEVTEQNPEIINPIVNTLPVQRFCAFSIQGIDKTAMVSGEFRKYLPKLGELAKLPAVWMQVPTWDSMTEKPMIPVAKEITKPVSITMARNETECAAVALTNISTSETRDFEVELTGFRKAGDSKPVNGIKGKLKVAGAIGSMVFGVNIGPLFEEDNMLGKSLMQKYITNWESISDFPKLKLRPMSSAIVWVSITTKGVAPGIYEADLKCTNSQSKKIKVEVLDVTLPDTTAWIETYSYLTNQFPFEYSDRMQREVDYRQSIGANVWHGAPTPGSSQEYARKTGKAIFHMYGNAWQYLKYKAEDIKPEDEKVIADNLKSVVASMKSLGLGYDDFFVEYFDEPAGDGLKLYEKFAEIAKKADPKVHIYCNPTSDELGDWYNKYIDVSDPTYQVALESGKAKPILNVPRFINTFYRVATSSSKGERAPQIELYRSLAWESAIRGWNGWGFYAYYRPEGNPWNDFDGDPARKTTGPDYSMVYPGPRGPIATRPSEAVREGLEDYKLISLMRSLGMNQEAEAICKAYQSGESMQTLRLRALHAVANHKKK